MDEVFVSGEPIDKRRLKALSRRSDAKGLFHLAAHFAALLFTGMLVLQAAGSLWLAPAMLLHGAVLIFLFAPLHETIHRTAFASRWLNDAVAWLCGAPLLLLPEYFRAFHFAHHRYTQDAARDPELAAPKPRSRGEYLWRLTGLPIWREHIATILRHAAGRVEEPFIAPRQHPVVVRQARLFCALAVAVGVVSVATGSHAVLTLWLVPALLGQPFLRAYLLAEHTGCPLVPDMFENSRTTRSNALVRWLAWNMPYHTAHHAYPAVPFHALPAAHAVIADRVKVRAPGYVAVNRALLAALR